MRTLIVLALLLALVAPTKAALAEDREWIDDVPKQGTSGFLECHAEAAAGGNRYRYMTYVDAGLEQLRTCERWAREDITRYFQVRYGLQIDPSTIQVTHRVLP
jgi:hypothetical protein